MLFTMWKKKKMERIQKVKLYVNLKDEMPLDFIAVRGDKERKRSIVCWSLKLITGPMKIVDEKI